MRSRCLWTLLALVLAGSAVGLELPRAFTAGSSAPFQEERVRQIVPTLDGGYFLIGERQITSSSFFTEIFPQTFVRRVARNLSTRWDRTFHGSVNGRFVPFGDGGWLVSSQTRTPSLFGFEALRLDGSGNVVAEVTRFRADATSAGEWLPSGLGFPGAAIVGNDLVVGTTVAVGNPIRPSTDVVLMRLRPDGTVVWSRRVMRTGSVRLSALASGATGLWAVIDSSSTTSVSRAIFRVNPDTGILSTFVAPYVVPRWGTSPFLLAVADRLLVLEETTNASRIRPALTSFLTSSGGRVGSVLLGGTTPVALATRRGLVYALSRDVSTSSLRVSEPAIFSSVSTTSIPGSATDLTLGPPAVTGEWLAVSATEAGRMVLRVYRGQPLANVASASAAIPSGHGVISWLSTASFGVPFVAASTQPTSPIFAPINGFSGSAPLSGLTGTFTVSAGPPREVPAADVGRTGVSDGAGGLAVVGSSDLKRGLFVRFDSAGTAVTTTTLSFDPAAISGGLDFVFRLSGGDYYVSGPYQVRVASTVVTRRALMRLSPTGTVVWRQTVDVAPFLMASARAVTVERDGDLWVLSRGRNASEAALMRRYDRNGILQATVPIATASTGVVLDIIVLADGRFLVLRQVSEPGLLRARLDLVPATGGDPIGAVFVNGVGSRTVPFGMVRNGNEVFVFSATNFRGSPEVADCRTTPISLVTFTARPPLPLLSSVRSPAMLRTVGNRTAVRAFMPADQRHVFRIVNVNPGSGSAGVMVFTPGSIDETWSTFAPWNDVRSLLAFASLSVPSNGLTLPNLTVTHRNGMNLLGTATARALIPGYPQYAADIVPVSDNEAWIVGSDTTRLGGDEVAVWRVRP